MTYQEMTKEELLEERQSLQKEYDAWKRKNLSLNMARGKPSKAQLDLSNQLMDVLNSNSYFNDQTGTDCRNYGVGEGIPEAKALMGEMSEVSPDDMIIFGNSSLNIMFDSIARSYAKGVCGSTPWCKLDKWKFLCPVPGYDRHFRVTEFFGAEMINIPMTPDGPDMDMVEDYVNNDPAVKGIWCVPKYSNPQGYSYSDETVRRFANLTPAASDFRIYWDNAYSIHHLYDEPEKQDVILEILDECRKAGHPDMVYKFISTSKVTFPGSGLAAMAASKRNLDDVRKYMSAQTIGHDKLNQLRHVRFFGNLTNMKQHMRKHAAILRPKFEAVWEIFDKKLGGLGVGEWTKPNGGYFVSFDALPGCAKKIVAMCGDCGVTLTPAGATYPYGRDPEDKNIRIAPSYPPLDELKEAAEIFTICVRIVSIDKILDKAE
ncbi:MAG: aminotransferase [Lachnospiraceae bacterium]|nr:aminotransferase [Lachnospiraceae bacterium]MDD7326568.1 aminotransferase [Lachnospiraceae bacterium]MDY2758699.1 aminotransferase [Lachnospiraceae bacterium]